MVTLPFALLRPSAGGERQRQKRGRDLAGHSRCRTRSYVSVASKWHPFDGRPRATVPENPSRSLGLGTPPLPTLPDQAAEVTGAEVRDEGGFPKVALLGDPLNRYAGSWPSLRAIPRVTSGRTISEGMAREVPFGWPSGTWLEPGRPGDRPRPGRSGLGGVRDRQHERRGALRIPGQRAIMQL
jgi:hypothetical protein